MGATRITLTPLLPTDSPTPRVGGSCDQRLQTAVNPSPPRASIPSAFLPMLAQQQQQACGCNGGGATASEQVLVSSSSVAEGQPSLPARCCPATAGGRMGAVREMPGAQMVNEVYIPC